MQRRLVLMRHAKSSWSSAGDHARPLDDSGRLEAPVVAAELADRGWVPDEVLSSDSSRTRETWAHMEAVLGPRPVTWSRALYHAGVDPFVEEVGLVGAEVRTLLVLGHNPGWQEIARWLTGEEVRLATAHAALLVGEGDTWAASLRPRAWQLLDVIRPVG